MLISRTTKALAIYFTFVISSQFMNVSNAFHFPETHVVDGEEILTASLAKDLECIRLEDCDTLSWLLRDTKGSQRISTDEINNVLREKRCELTDIGSDNIITLDTKVACPKVKDTSLGVRLDDGNEEDYDLTFDDLRSVTDNLARGKQSLCSLKIQHAPLGSLTEIDIRALSGDRKEYRHLKRLAERQILRITADGNCCWTVYPEKGFAGEQMYVSPDNEVFPELSIKSTRQVDCE